MPSNTGYDVRGALNSNLRSSFGDESFVNGKYSAQAAVDNLLRNQFGDSAFPNGQYSAQAALNELLRNQFGDEAFPGADPQPGGPPPPRIPDVAPPVDEEQGPVFTPNPFDPGTFGPDFNSTDGFPGPFGPNFNRPQNAAEPDPASVTDPNEGRSYRLPGFGNPNPGPQSGGGRSPTASAPLPASTPQRTLFANTPPARFGTGGAGSASRINGGSTRLRKFLGAA